MKKIISLLMLILILFSCNFNKKKKSEERKKINELRKQEKEKAIDNLVSKYSIQYNWDTLNYNYSIKYKPVIESNCQIIYNVEINDIYEKDSIKYISIKTGIIPLFYFDFPITKEQENIFINEGNDVILVVSIQEIRKIKFYLESEVVDAGSSILNLDQSADFIGKGKIVDIIKTNKITSD